MWSRFFKGVAVGLFVGTTVVPARAQITNLMDWTSSWRYFQGGRLPAANWSASNYADASWPLAPGVFGVPMNEPLPVPGLAVTTPLNLGADGYTFITYYFRTTFNLPRTNIVVTASNLVDDGAVFYLNGQEVRRLGMNAGPVDYSTLANRTGSTTEVLSRGVETFAIPLTHAVAGENVLAVEVHQITTNNSDAVFSMKLVADLLQPPTITRQPEDLTLQEGTRGGFTNDAVGSPPLTYRWYATTPPFSNFTFVGTGSNVTVNPAMLSQNGRKYRAVVSNAWGMVTSRVATLTVIRDTFGPGLLTATATSSNQIDLRWDEALRNGPPTTVISNYAVHILGTANTVEITNVVYGVNQVRLRLGENLSTSSNYVVCARNIEDAKSNRTANVCLGVAFITSLTPVQFGSKWHFFASVSGEPVATNWAQLQYQPDDNWGEGFARFAFDYGGMIPTCSPEVRTILPIGLTAYYFRKTFSMFSTLTPPITVGLHVVVDDGAVFYINGAEIYRLRMPPAPAVITATTYANVRVEDGICEMHSVEIPGDLLRAGANVLAVEVHQWPNEPFQEDVSFDTELTFTYRKAPLIPHLVIRRDGASIEATWSGEGWTLETAPGLNGPWTTEAAPGNVFQGPASGERKFFRLKNP